MCTPLPTRRLVGGVPCALLALLLVLARLLAPAMAMPMAGAALSDIDRLARESICHVPADDPDDPAHGVPAGSNECLACPVCHLAAASVLPAPDGPVLPPPGRATIGRSAPPPPATGPPIRKRAAAQPTGPPLPSA